MRSTRLLLLTALAACSGDDGPATPDPIDAAASDAAPGDAAGPDAAVLCPTWESCETAERSGVLYAAGCAPVPCGLWRYQSHDLDAHAESPAVGGLGPTTRVAYVRTTGSREVRLATFEGAWRDVAVAPVLAAGATEGSAVTIIGDAAGDVVWVAWSEADGTINLAHRVDRIVTPPPWTLTRNLATGTRPVLVTGVQPILVHAGAGGIHVRRYDGATWSAPTVIAAAPTQLTATAFDDGFANVVVAWRTAAGDVKVARSRNAMPFVITDLETGLTTPIGGASVMLAPSGGVIAYTQHDHGSTRAELLSDGTWRKQAFGHFANQGSGVGVTQSPRAGAAYTSTVGVHTVDFGTNGFPVEQVVSTRCGNGQLLAASYFTDPLLVHLCDDGTLYSVRGLGAAFPTGWHDRCAAVGGELADTARACATTDACIIKDGRRFCAAGIDADDLAYAQVCGEPTVDPSSLDACEPAAAAVTCVPDGMFGTATVPAACSP